MPHKTVTLVFALIAMLTLGMSPSAEAAQTEDPELRVGLGPYQCARLGDRLLGYTFEGLDANGYTSIDNTIGWQNGSTYLYTGSSNKIFSYSRFQSYAYAGPAGALRGDITTFAATRIYYVDQDDSADGVGGTHWLGYETNFKLYDDATFSSTYYNSRQQVVNGTIPPPTSPQPTLTIFDSSGNTIAMPDIESSSGAAAYTYVSTPTFSLPPGEYTMQLVLEGSRQVQPNWKNAPMMSSQGTFSYVGFQSSYPSSGPAIPGIGLSWKLDCSDSKVPHWDDFPMFEDAGNDRDDSEDMIPHWDDFEIFDGGG